MSVQSAAAAGRRQRQAGADPWDDPVPLFADNDPPAPYPIEALPPVMSAAVRDYQAFGRQPVELVACSALSAASLCCQGLADVDRDGNLVGPCSLSFLTVAISGERKTAADLRMRRAVRGWQEERRAAQELEISAAQRRFDIWRSRRDGMLQKIKRLSGSNARDDRAELARLEREFEGVEDSEPKIPAVVQLFHEDASPERLAVNLAKGWPSSSLWSDEAGLIVGSHAMSEEVALRFLTLLNRLWDGGEFMRERETTTSAHIRGRRFTVSLMLQPHILGKLLAIGDGVARGVGALGRFLLCWPVSTMGGRFYVAGDLNSPALAAFDGRLRALLDAKLQVDDDGGLKPRRLRLSRGAQGAFKVWQQFHDQVEQELGKDGAFADLRDLGAKCAEQAARIACVLQLFEAEDSTVITTQMMLSGANIALWHLHEGRRVLERIGWSGETADAQLLLDWLLTQEADPAINRVLQFGPNALRDKKRRDRAIAKLAEHTLARLEEHDGKTRLVLNPTVHAWPK